jgi:hypothetical protein
MKRTLPLLAILLSTTPARAQLEAHSVIAPPSPVALTRFTAEVRPFLSLTGNGGGGAISDLVLERYFKNHLKLSGELAPIALGIDRYDKGAIVHGRLGIAYWTDLLEVGIAAGTRLQNLGGGGYSLAAQLRLGAIDGLRLLVGYGYVVARNYNTGKVGASLSNIRAKISVPVSRRARLFLDGAFSYDVWVYGIVGLEQALGGDLSDAPWRLSLGFGPALVVDRFGCAARYPVPCGRSTTGLGPTIAVGLERRF